MLPPILYLSLVTTLCYILITLDDTMYKKVYLKICKVDILFNLTVSSWLTFNAINMFEINGYIIFSCIFVVIILLQAILYWGKTRKELNKIETKITNIDSIFKNKEGTIIQPMNDGYFLGEIVLDNKKQQILVYSETGFENGDNFVITAIDGPKILAEKKVVTEVGTEFAEEEEKENNI